MNNFIAPKILPQIEPRFEEINYLRSLGCVAYYDLARDKGSKIFNLMNYNPPFTNLVVSPELNTDSNSDGVVDNFIFTKDAGITATASLDGVQKINITNSTTTSDAYINQTVLNISAGEVISISAIVKISGTIRARLRVDWLTSAGAYITSTANYHSSSTEFTKMTAENLTAPANTAKALIRVGLNCSVIGNTGSGWFGTLVLVKAATLESSGTNGIVTGATPYPLGKYFDGVDDKIQIPDNAILNPINEFSIECIIKPTTQQNGKGIMGKGTTGASNYSYMLYLTNLSGTLSLYVNHIGGAAIAAYATGVSGYFSDKGFYHIIGVYNRYAIDGNRLKLYINNKLVAINTGEDKSVINSGAFPFSICNCYDITFFKSIFGQARYYNRALTAPQITQLFKMYAPFYKIAS